MAIHGRSFSSLFIPTRTNEKEGESLISPFKPDGLLIDLGSRMADIAQSGESDLPAGYTYFGQFIDHDITKTKGSDDLASERINPASNSNQTSPELDLSSLYWPGDLQSQRAIDLSNGKLLLGHVSSCPTQHGNCEFDLPRDSNKKAIIPDQRNDENLLIAQLHVQFILMHNNLIEHLRQSHPTYSASSHFNQARATLLVIYRRIVVNDFLKRLLNKTIWDLYFNSTTQDPLAAEIRELKFFFKTQMSAEFSAAAFRFGHVLVRPSYRINRFVEEIKLAELFAWTGKGNLNGEPAIPITKVVNWQAFFQQHGIQSAQRTLPINPGIGINIPHLVWPANVLAIRNLIRGQAHNLPSGQRTLNYVLQYSGLSQDLKKLLEKTLQGLTHTQINPKVVFNNGEKEHLLHPLTGKNKIIQETPLLYYLLCEFRANRGMRIRGSNKSTPTRLGPLASLIIAETFFNILKNTKSADTFTAYNNINSMLDFIKITQPKEI